MSNIEPRAVWNCECKSGTGPLWLQDAGMLLFCDPAQGRILHFDPVSGKGGTFEVGGKPSFVVPTQDGQLLYGTERQLKLIGVDGEAAQALPIETSPRNRTGDGTVDSKGRLWFSVGDAEGEKPVGGLFRYFDERMIPTLFDMVAPHGPAITADDRTLYQVDTSARRIDRYAINHAAALSNSETFLEFGEADGLPRGIALDVEDCLWVAFAETGRVRRYSPSGEMTIEVALPCRDATGLAFGGADRSSLFVTTARCDDEGLSGALFAFEAPIAGPLVPAMKITHGSSLGLVDDDDH